MTADLVFINARVATIDPARPTAGAVAVRRERILFVGSEEGVRDLIGPRTRVVDGRGGTLMPGFIDSHFHLLWGSLSLGDIELRGVRTLDEIRARTLAFLRRAPEKAWVVGRNLPYAVPSAVEPLTRFHLDEIVRDRPFFVSSYDYHTIWANTAALQAAGLLHAGSKPVGPNSEIVRLPDGSASGELREPGAYRPLLDQVPPPTDVEKIGLLKKGLALAASLGITSAHNMDGNPRLASLFAALEDRDELTMRLVVPYDVRPDTPFESLADEALPMKRRFKSPLIRAGAVKFFMDGVLESYTAFLVDPYADDPATRGSTLFEPDHFRRLAVEADRLGLQIFVHACGDGAVRRVLDGYEAARQANGPRDSRHRVEHIELIHPEDLPRFAELGVIASMQPLHAPMLDREADVWPARAGEARWPWSFAWRRLREAGARLTFGSDWPVVTLDPMAGLDDGLNRRPWGDEGSDHYRLTLAELVAGYTRDAAYAEFQEEQKGIVAENYLADLVLLDRDLFATPAAEITEVRPVLTVCGGRVVYERN